MTDVLQRVLDNSSGTPELKLGLHSNFLNRITTLEGQQTVAQAFAAQVHLTSTSDFECDANRAKFHGELSVTGGPVN